MWYNGKCFLMTAIEVLMGMILLVILVFILMDSMEDW